MTGLRFTGIILALTFFSTTAIASDLSEADVRAYYAAWSKADIDAIINYFHSDCVYEDVATGDLSRGHDELRDFAKKFLDGSPGVTVEPATITIGADRIAVEWLMSGGVGDDAWSVRGVAILEPRGEKIVRATDYWNAEG